MTCSFKKLLASSASSAAILSSSVPASAAVYIVDLDIGAGGATGSITTDDTLGVLSTANVTDWSLLLDDGLTTSLLDGPSNSALVVQGQDFTATSTGLFFNFDSIGLVLFRDPNLAPAVQFLCFTGNRTCATTRNGIEVSTTGRGNVQISPQQGVVQIATIVPEPATWALMMLGFGAVGGAMRRARVTSAKISFA